MRAKPNNPAQWEFTYSDKNCALAFLEQELAGRDPHFVEGLISQILNAVSPRESIDLEATNFVLSTVKSIKPRDQLEAMLAAQMGVIQDTIMKVSASLRRAMFGPHQENCLRNLVNLTRTFAVLMETLKRYRASGEQKVVVQHVSVNDGSQAVVSFDGPPKRRRRKRATDSPAALPHSETAPMEILEEHPEQTAVEVPKPAVGQK